MPWIEFTCCCGCGRSKRAYWQPSVPKPKFFSRACTARSRRPPESPVKWRFTPEMDAALRLAYSEGRKRGAVKALYGSPEFRSLAGCPRYVLYYRARHIGLAIPQDQRVWAQKEISIVEALAGEACVEVISRKLAKAGFRRSVGAVANRLWKSYRRSVRGQAWTAGDISRLLGWDEKAVVRWIALGLLRAARSAGGGVHRIAPVELARFIRDEADRLRARRLDLPEVIRLLEEYPRSEGRGAPWERSRSA